MSCLHHCRTGTRSGCCLANLPLAVHPYTSGKQSLEFMQWNTAGLRSWINFNLHHHGTGFAWQPDGYICYDLRPSVWICVSI